MSRLITETDDWLGRTMHRPVSHGVKMNLREDWDTVQNAGDYSFIEYACVECLIVLCPFCGYEAPVPHLVKVSSKEPLDIKQELYCEKCHTIFHIIEGFAYKSWIPLEALKRCLNHL